MTRWFSIARMFVVLVAMVLLASCAPTGASAPETTSSPVAIAQPSASPTPTLEPTMTQLFAKLPKLEGSATVEMTLKNGTVVLELDGTNAPVTAGNFADLVSRGFYDNLTFHRVVKDPSPFVAQGGDPLGNGTGGFTDPQTKQPRNIPLEIKVEGEAAPTYSKVLPNTSKIALRHNRGALAMARSQNPDSASSQFYITLAETGFLDGSYAVFGKVVQGMELVDQITVGDAIVSMTLTKGKENLKPAA
ncbi:MAG: peptidylprolyl isomerase [Oscillatoriales cyanobacterium SM2_2_1]|nr:peptidylprolyl isomerase [Oscillatoriales cyanobacterium SM2_2_1]